MKALGLTVLNFLNATRALGIDAEAKLFPGLSFTRADLDAGLLWAPWDDVAMLYNRLEPLLSDAQAEAVVRQHMVTHPGVRVVAQFAASPMAWFDLFWRVSVPYNPMTKMSHSVEGDEATYEAELHDGLAPCSLWFKLSHHAAACTLVAIGGEVMETKAIDCGPRHVRSRFALPVERSAEERIKRASEIPLTTVFASLELLGANFGEAIRDGHLRFDESVRGHIDEVATLATAWSLTPTEARVVLSLAKGNTPAEVAEELGMALATVRVHLKHAYAKTETSGQRELVTRVQSWRLT